MHNFIRITSFPIETELKNTTFVTTFFKHTVLAKT